MKDLRLKRVDYDKQQSRTIEFLRFPLTVGIILSHTLYFFDVPFGFSSGTSSIFEHLEGLNSYAIIRYLLSSLIPRCCVPTFLFISGFLLFYNIQEYNLKTYHRKLHSRIYTLLIPYILWNLFQMGYVFVLYFTRDVPLPNNLWTWLCFFWGSSGIQEPINNSLWYVLEIMMFAVLSPIVYILFKYLRFWPIIAIFGLFLCGLAQGGYLDPLYLFFLLSGAYFGYEKINICHFVEQINKHRTIVYLSTVLLFVSCFCFEGLPKSLYGERHSLGMRILSISYICSMILSLFCLVSSNLQANRIKTIALLSGCSFFIYCLHLTFPFTITDAFVDKYFNGSPSYICIMVHIAMILFRLLTCMLIYAIMKAKCPKVLNILVGKR